MSEELTLHLPQQIHLVRTGETIVLEHRKDHAIHNEPARENREVPLPIPGRVAVPGTPWTAVAEIVSDEERQRMREVLQCKNKEEVWRILEATRYVIYIDGDNVGNVLRIRTRRPGDRIRPLGMAHEKKIQDVLIDKHIIRAEREQIPLFFSASHCVWLAGICLDDRVRLIAETRQIVRLSIIPT